MEYQEAVTEARTLVKRSENDQWRLAELTWQQVEGGATRRQWARDVGVHHSYTARLYLVWAAHRVDGVEDRPPFSEAYNETNTGVEPIGRARTAVRNMPPEQKAEVVREALEDQAVAERVVADDQTALNITKARAKHTTKRETEQREAQTMRAPALADAGDLAELGNNMAHIATRLEMLAAQVQGVPTSQRGQFAREWADIKRLVGWVDSVLSGESMDEGLTKLLNGGDDR